MPEGDDVIERAAELLKEPVQIDGAFDRRVMEAIETVPAPRARALRGGRVNSRRTWNRSRGEPLRVWGGCSRAPTEHSPPIPAMAATSPVIN